MPKHAILITWRNMEPKVLPAFIERAKIKYGENLKRLYFENASVQESLKRNVDEVAAEESLKIFISGHGGTGIDYITDDSQRIKKTVPELVDLLAFALAKRAKSTDTSSLTQVSMISCLFGRTPDGMSASSPAAKVHTGLAAKGIYVDLTARTESIVETAEGRQTISALKHYVYEPVYGRLPKFYMPRAPYTKVRHTFSDGAPVSQIAAYDGDDTYSEASTLDGRRLLWADYVVNELVKRIELKGTGTFATGPKDVTDSRQQVLRDLVTWYDNVHHPAGLKVKLETLIDGTGDNESDNFLIHRNALSRKFSSEEPKTAQLIRSLLASYP